MPYSRSYLLQKPKPSRSKRRLLLFVITVMLLVLAVVIAINVISAFNSFQNSEPWAQSLRLQGVGNDVIYLLYGVDYWGASPYVERVLLLHHDTLTNQLSLVYIPGNTMIETDDRGPEPLGQLYRRLSKPDYIDQIQEFTGLPIHHYVELNYQGIAVLGDYLGKVETDALTAGAPGNMLPLDQEYLDGFALYRYFLTSQYQESPLNQISRQQQALLQLWRKHEQIKIWQWPRLMNLAAEYIETDLSWRELRALGDRFADYSFDDVRQVMLTGKEAVHEGCLYWVTDPEAVKDMVRMVNEGYLVVPSAVKVEVLNGSGITGLAARVSAMLKDEGFSVIGQGQNADRNDYAETLVFGYGQVADNARAVALYVPGSTVVHQYDPGALVDVTVIIGRNYEEYTGGN